MFRSILLFTLCFSFSVSANDQLYGVFNISYADVSLNESGADNIAYKLGIGYEFDKQWYAEFGYQQLVDEKQSNEAMLMQGDALYASVLGKAAGRQGELFYRLSVLNIDISGQEALQDNNQCARGSVNPIGLCQFDSGILAGGFGLGFDFYMGPRGMLRTEIEYIKGQEDFDVTALHVGYRYHF